MAHARGEIVAGGVVLLVAAGFLAYVAQTTGLGGAARDTVVYTASFRSVEGISIGTDVRLAGVDIGTVTAVALNPQTYRADMSVALDASVEIPDDSSIAITSEGLLGGNFVEIIPGGSPFALAAGGSFEDTQGALSLIGLLARFVAASTDGE